MSNIVWNAENGWHDGDAVSVNVDKSGRLVTARIEQLRASLRNDPFRGFDRDPADVESERSELAALEALIAAD